MDESKINTKVRIREVDLKRLETVLLFVSNRDGKIYSRPEVLNLIITEFMKNNNIPGLKVEHHEYSMISEVEVLNILKERNKFNPYECEMSVTDYNLHYSDSICNPSENSVTINTDNITVHNRISFSEGNSNEHQHQHQHQYIIGDVNISTTNNTFDLDKFKEGLKKANWFIGKNYDLSDEDEKYVDLSDEDENYFGLED